MNLTPKRLATLLASSSLLPEEQESILNSLEYLDQDQIESLGECLEKDSKKLKKFLANAERDTVQVLTEMHLKLETE